MPIGIIGAMPQEIDLLRAEMRDAAETVAGMRSYARGKLSGRDVVLAFSRWGKVAATATAVTMIERFGVDSLWFTGVAGALDPRLNVGDIVVGTELTQHDLDASALPGLAVLEVPLLGVSRFRSDTALADRAAAAAERYLTQEMRREIPAEALARFGMTAPKVHRGVIVSGDQFIADQARADAIRRLVPDALCVEMEGAAVAQVAFEYRVPFAVVRVISDRSDHAAPVDFMAFIQSAARHLTCGVVRRMLGDPA
jgi:adenosylhomocysteine nucleosidase